MQKLNRGVGMLFGLLAALGMAGCEATNTTVVNNATPSPPVAQAAMPTPTMATGVGNQSADDLAVTLPVLDAFFADESFTGDLKNKLQLTDDRIASLRNVAREETAKLREERSEARDDYAGSTQSAHSLYQEKVANEIGQDKTRQLSDLVKARWNGGDTEGNATNASTSVANKPNAIPTDTRIVVNIPAYRMDIFRDGELTKSYKVGIGYPEFPLPTGMRKAQTIIFNPTWTPPDEPWVESPSSKVKVGQKIEAGSKLNPLGPIKIPIGLPSLIHGGKAPAKLGGFASHGCVGLTNDQVQEFARELAALGGSEITPEQIADYEKNKTETKNVKLETSVPVELRYETIVVQDGKLHIYRDVYDRGTNNEDNLRAALAAYGVSPDDLSEAERASVTAALAKMARDAMGKPVAAQTTAPEATPTMAAKKKSSDDEATSGKVTRTIKGEKEIVIEIAALKDKGYPAPVDLNAGGAKSKTQTAESRREKR